MVENGPPKSAHYEVSEQIARHALPFGVCILAPYGPKTCRTAALSQCIHLIMEQFQGSVNGGFQTMVRVLSGDQTPYNI